MPATLRLAFLLPVLLIAAVVPNWANNVQVSSVQLGTRNTANDTREIQFNISWSNSWNQSYGRDAAWIFVKYRKAGTATWHHAYLGNTGSHYAGNLNTAVLEVGYKDPSASYHQSSNPTLGVYLYDNASNRNMTTVSSTGVKVLWNYAANTERPLGDNDEVEVRVYAIEMVYVPGGATFRVGDGGASTKSLRTAKNGNPYDVTFGGNGYDLVDTFSGITHLATQSVGNGTKAKSLSLTYNLPAGDNHFALITFLSKASDPTSITLGSTTLTASNLVKNVNTDKTDTWVYKLVPNSAHNGQTLKASFAETNSAYLTISTFSGVNQTTPVDTFYGINNTTATALQTGIPWEKEDYIFGAVSTEKAAVTVPSRQTTLTNTSAIVGEIFAATSLRKAASNPTDTISYTLASAKKSSLVTVVLKPEPQAGGVSISGQNGLGNNASFPTGYDPFYCMKYEVTQAQYAAFLNTLTIAQQQQRTASAPDSPPGTGALSSLNDYRNGIDVMTPAGQNPAVYACNLDGNGTYNDPEADGMPLACNYLAWDDLAAWLDWAALRPMTELEFEKACRGIGITAYKYPWGASGANLVGGNSFTNLGKTSEELLSGTDEANVNAGNAFQGPVRIGVFARDGSAQGNKFSGKTTRYHSGASRLGILDLAGNVWEQLVTVEMQEGRDFAGNHGDGSLTTDEWPGLTTSTGTGSRGGGWDSSSSTDLHVSDRSKADFVPATRHQAYGGRGARSAD